MISACSHYWNTCMSLSKQLLERVQLRDPLTELLNMVAPLLAHRNKVRVTCCHSG